MNICNMVIYSQTSLTHHMCVAINFAYSPSVSIFSYFCCVVVMLPIITATTFHCLPLYEKDKGTAT